MDHLQVLVGWQYMSDSLCGRQSMGQTAVERILVPQLSVGNEFRSSVVVSIEEVCEVSRLDPSEKWVLHRLKQRGYTF